MSELADASLHSHAEGAKHWKSLRRKVIIKLQLTFNIFDSLVDHANASSGDTVFDGSHRVVLKSYNNLGEKTGGGRQPNLRQADVRQRALRIMIFTIFHPTNPFSHGSMTLMSFLSNY